MKRASSDDAGFFLQAARVNLDQGDLEAALACLESAATRRPSAADVRELRALADRLGGLDVATADLRARARSLLGGAVEPVSASPATGVETAPPAKSPRPASDASLEMVRRLLVSPELVERLRTLVAARPNGAGAPSEPLTLPAADVISRLLAVELDLPAVAELALDLVVRATGADRGWVLLGGEEKTSFGQRGSSGPPPEASAGVLREMEATRATVLVEDATADPRFASRESVRELQLRSVLCVPIRIAVTEPALGAIYLDAPSGVGRFGRRETELAELLASAIAPSIRNARRFAEQSRELARTKRAYAEARSAVLPIEGEPLLLGASRAMKELQALIARVAPGGHTILIEGESGSGKELVARAIHARSERAAGPFLGENVAAFGESTLESELFGHEKGAFTGADRARPGIFQLAEGGTLLLDEVSEMTESMQRKLLRVLQEREVRPMGASSAVPVDVRVLAATNRDLAAMVHDGSFREDLYFRLAVIRIHVPPLRKRLEDLPLLLSHFVARAAALQDRPAPPLNRELVAKLSAYRWPGNVRELEAFATRLVLEGPGADLGAERFDGEERGSRSEGPFELEVRLSDGSAPPLRDARTVFDRAYIALVLQRHGGNVTAAATALGLNRGYVSTLVKRFGLKERADDKPA